MKNKKPFAWYMFSELSLAVVLVFAAGFCLGYYSADAKQNPVEPNVIAETKQETTIAPNEFVEQEKEIEQAQERESLGVFQVTYYCPCEKCCAVSPDGITASGTVATQGRTIAVDTRIIPMGAQVLLVYEDGAQAVYTAEDTGSAVKGNRLDVFMDSHEAALQCGVKNAEVFLLGE